MKNLILVIFDGTNFLSFLTFVKILFRFHSFLITNIRFESKTIKIAEKSNFFKFI
jgi:hypothetical protein